MKIIIVTVLVLSATYAALEAKSLNKRQVQEPIYGNDIPGEDAQILYQNFYLTPNESYSFNYNQTDLQSRSESATFKVDPKTQNKYVIDIVEGSYEYVRPDGKWQRVRYTSDENGYRAKVETHTEDPIFQPDIIEQHKKLVVNGGPVHIPGDNGFTLEGRFLD